MKRFQKILEKVGPNSVRGNANSKKYSTHTLEIRPKFHSFFSQPNINGKEVRTWAHMYREYDIVYISAYIDGNCLFLAYSSSQKL